MEDVIVQRIKEFIRENSYNETAFAKEIGVRQNTLNQQLRGDRSLSLEVVNKIMARFDSISSEWLLRGSGEMFKEAEESPQIQVLHRPKVKEKIIEQQSIPVYNIEAAANLKTVFDQKEQNILGEITMPNIPRCDGAVYVRGDSMYPLLKSGDLVGYKELTDPSDLIFGEMYLVSFELAGDEYIVVKYINKSEIPGCIKLVSYNPYYDPKDIEISRLTAVALIKFSIRKNTIA